MKSRWERFDPETAWETWQPGEDSAWDFSAANHLHRRAGFGATWEELQRDLAGAPGEAVERLFSPVRDQNEDAAGLRMAEALAASSETRQLSAWWILGMARTPDPVLEKATLFWHGHFATSAAKVNEARLMLAQMRLLRQHALGPFEPMVQGIAEDPAMLIYLDSRESRRSSPNENFARELMELFCLGPGHYTEQDIREMARCFTGFEIRYSKFRYNAFQHDNGVKRFLGTEGNFGGADAVRTVVAQPACPEFLVGKLLRYYVADDFPADSALTRRLAKDCREHGLDMGWTIRRIVSSKLFFAPEARASRISSPVEMTVGLLRRLGMKANINTLAEAGGELGQLPFYPPSVKGWNGGTEWINAQTVQGRANLVMRLMQENAGSFRAPVPAHPSRQRKEAVEQLCQLFLGQALPARLQEELVGFADSEGLQGKDLPVRLIPVLAAFPEFHVV